MQRSVLSTTKEKANPNRVSHKKYKKWKVSTSAHKFSSDVSQKYGREREGESERKEKNPNQHDVNKTVTNEPYKQ